MKINKIWRQVFKLFLSIFFILFLGALGSSLFDYYLAPKLNRSHFLFWKNNRENTTIIEKTREIVLKDEKSINEISARAATAIVNIVSISDKNSSTKSESERGNFKNGSGLIVTGDGLVVTYRKAILEEKATYKIFIFDGSVFDAKLLGVDNFSDLAYFKIEASNLPAIPFANSDELIAGKKIIALANSEEEYRNRYGTGILSNWNKTFNLAGKTTASSEKMEGVWETDFSPDKEYIGGSVINYNGELVGILGMTEIDNQENYFLIPSNRIKKNLEMVSQEIFDKQPHLGVYYLSLTKTNSLSRGIRRDRGALIFSPSGKSGLAVLSGSVAEKSGLRIGDIIIAVNDQEINLDNPLSNLINRFHKGEEVELLVDRNGQEIKIKVKF